MPVPSSSPVSDDPKRLNQVAELAESIALNTFHDRSVDPAHLLDGCRDLTWSYGDYGDHFDGLIEYHGRGFHVYVNRERSLRLDGGRGAFTMAHELGHYFIDEHRHWLMHNPNRSHCSFVQQEEVLQKPHEREADVFATNLIIPRKTFANLIGCPTPSIEEVRKAADYFHTSLTTTAIRFIELEPFPCVIICWYQGRRKWAKRSPSVARCYGDVAWSVEGTLSESLSAKVLRGDIVLDEPKSQTTVAEDWFPRMKHVMDCKGFPLERLCVPLDEHVMSLGRHGFLTMICGHNWTGLGSVRAHKSRVAGK